MMKSLAAAAMTAYAAQAIEKDVEFEMISELQVNQRTLLNDWRLDMMYEVDAEESREASKNILSVTTILTNKDVTKNGRKVIQDGEIFQTYFSMKDPEQQGEVTVQIPAPTADLDKTIDEMQVPVPFYENFVCSMQYFKEKTANIEPPFPEDQQTILKSKTRQSCGVIPVHKWNSGTYDEVAIYHDDSVACSGDKCINCQGDDWTIDLEKTKFIVSEDGNEFEARCTFSRPFSKGSMREIAFDESLDWMGGYNIYKSETAQWRYVYGYSYESNLSNKEVSILANAVRETLMMSLTLAAAGLAILL